MEILKAMHERMETRIGSFASQMKAVQEEKGAIQEKIEATIRSGQKEKKAGMEATKGRSVAN